MSRRKLLNDKALEQAVYDAAVELDVTRNQMEVEENESLHSQGTDNSEGSSYQPGESDKESESSEESRENIPLDAINTDDDQDGNTGDGDGDHSDEWTDSEDDPQAIPFVAKEEIKYNFALPIDPFETFSCLFDESLQQKIVEWTNIRAQQNKDNPTLGKKSNMRHWTDTNIAEFQKFLGLCLLIGNIHMPYLRNYWSSDPLYEHPIFGKVMSRNRFEMILRNICFYAPGDNTSSRLHKVANLTTHILNNIDKVYYPSENLSVDEALLLWRGRLKFRQYIPNKASKYGIKFYEICTPDGFVLDLLIYCGQGTVQNEQGHAFEVVRRLGEKFFEKGHTIYMDNFYCSYKLAKYLLENKTYMCGTLRKNRKGNPPSVVSTKLKKGNLVWKRKGQIRVLKWHDKRDVLMISSKHKSGMMEVTSKTGVKKNKPEMVVEYNKHMSGVDRADQMTSYYSTPRKTIRWYMKVFFHLLDLCLWNGNYLLNKINKKKISYLAYREHIIRKFLLVESRNKKSNVAAGINHFPHREDKRKRCRLCSQQKKRSMTWYSCLVCKDNKGNPVGLCPSPCFGIWH